MGVDLDFRGGGGPYLTANPTRQQCAERKVGRRTRLLAKRWGKADLHVYPEARKSPDRLGAGYLIFGVDPMPTQWFGNELTAATTADLRSATSAPASPVSSGTSTGADGMIAMALSTSPN